MNRMGRIVDPDEEIPQVEEGDDKFAKEPPIEEGEDGTYTDGDGDEDDVPAEPGNENVDQEEPDETPDELDSQEDDEKPLRAVKNGRIIEEPVEKSLSTETVNNDEVTIVSSDVLFNMLSEDIEKAFEPILDYLVEFKKSLDTNYGTMVKAINQQHDQIKGLREAVEPISKSLDSLKGVEAITKAADEAAKVDAATHVEGSVPAGSEIVSKSFVDSGATSPYVTEVDASAALSVIQKAIKLQDLTQRRILTSEDMSNLNARVLRKSRVAEIEAAVEKIEKSL